MSRDEKIANQIADYIRNNLDKPLNIPELSKKYQISKFTLERIFKKVFHQTLHQFILEKRLEEAYRLLAKTDLPIKEIIYMTGFKSITTFTNEFHYKFNITPAALRNEI